jgi:hypothetical protein
VKTFQCFLQRVITIKWWVVTLAILEFLWDENQIEIHLFYDQQCDQQACLKPITWRIKQKLWTRKEADKDQVLFSCLCTRVSCSSSVSYRFWVRRKQIIKFVYDLVLLQKYLHNTWCKAFYQTWYSLLLDRKVSLCFEFEGIFFRYIKENSSWKIGISMSNSVDQISWLTNSLWEYDKQTLIKMVYLSKLWLAFSENNLSNQFWFSYPFCFKTISGVFALFFMKGQP